jgi:hypothetical protein
MLPCRVYNKYPSSNGPKSTEERIDHVHRRHPAEHRRHADGRHLTKTSNLRSSTPSFSSTEALWFALTEVERERTGVVGFEHLGSLVESVTLSRDDRRVVYKTGDSLVN